MRNLIAAALMAASTAAAGAAAARTTSDRPLFQPRESDLLQMVNLAVNAAHAPGAALPSDPDGIWDCDNYAVAKYRTLRDDFRWAAERLAIGIVRLPDGERHMVVLVRADGDWAILDNLTNAIVPMATRTRDHWRVQFAAFEPSRPGAAGWRMEPRAAPIAFNG
jgi:predicted transglutaminase-like cysteine proteinase